MRSVRPSFSFFHCESLKPLAEEDVPNEYWLLVLKKTSRSPDSEQFLTIKQRFRSPNSKRRCSWLNILSDGFVVFIPYVLNGVPLTGDAFVIWYNSGLLFSLYEVTLLLNSSTLKPIASATVMSLGNYICRGYDLFCDARNRLTFAVK